MGPPVRRVRRIAASARRPSPRSTPTPPRQLAHALTLALYCDEDTSTQSYHEHGHQRSRAAQRRPRRASRSLISEPASFRSSSRSRAQTAAATALRA